MIHPSANRPNQILGGDLFENVFGQLFQAERLKRICFTDDYGFDHVHD